LGSQAVFTILPGEFLALAFSSLFNLSYYGTILPRIAPSCQEWFYLVKTFIFRLSIEIKAHKIDLTTTKQQFYHFYLDLQTILLLQLTCLHLIESSPTSQRLETSTTEVTIFE
jgi:hypothetical protein